MAPPLRMQLAVAALAIGVVLVVDSTGLVPPSVAVAVDNAAQWGGGLFA